MPWFKVDDSFHSHPKVLATTPAALGLWVVAGAWSSANLTEGFVPDHALPRLIPDSEPLAKELVSNGLWTRAKGGYRFHDFAEYNPTRSEAIAARDRQSSGGAIGNHRRWHEARGVTDPSCRYCQQEHPSGTDRVPDGEPDSGGNPPTRPDPSPPSGQGGSTTSRSQGGPGGGADAGASGATDDAKPKPKRADRGTRIPDHFPVTDDMRQWAQDKAPSCGDADHEAFLDYWRSKPGAAGRKVDWVATWRNWMRKEHERRAGRRTSGNVVALNRQQASDDMFDRALARAKEREAQMGIGDAQ